MGLLDRLFGRTEKRRISQQPPAVREPSDKEIFQSPSMLAAWVEKYVIRVSTVEDDFRMAPDEDSRRKLNITHEQVERLAREEGLLRAVGASYLVKQYYDDAFYLKFFSLIYAAAARHMYSDPSSDEISDTRSALEMYVCSIANPEDETLREFQKQYLQRIYDDNENFYKLMLGGIASLAIQTSLSTFEAMRDSYFRVTQGIPYESAKLIAEAMEKVGSERNA